MRCVLKGAFADSVFSARQPRSELEKAVATHVAKQKGEPIGIKALIVFLEEKFAVDPGTLNSRKDEIKGILLAAMGGVDTTEEPQARARAGTASTEPIAVGEDEADPNAGKNRAGQTPDLQGYLKKRGDQGRIKVAVADTLPRRTHFDTCRRCGRSASSGFTRRRA